MNGWKLWTKFHLFCFLILFLAFALSQQKYLWLEVNLNYLLSYCTNPCLLNPEYSLFSKSWLLLWVWCCFKLSNLSKSAGALCPVCSQTLQRINWFSNHIRPSSEMLSGIKTSSLALHPREAQYCPSPKLWMWRIFAPLGVRPQQIQTTGCNVF